MIGFGATHAGIRYNLDLSELQKHGEVPSHTPNLAQLCKLSYAGPVGQLRISWTEYSENLQD